MGQISLRTHQRLRRNVLCDEPIQESAVSAPSDFIAVGDSFSRSYITPETPIIEGAEFLTRRLHLFYNRPIAKRIKAASKRHDGYSHLLFCDGHVEAVKLEALLFSTNMVNLRRWHIDNEPHHELLR